MTPSPNHKLSDLLQDFQVAMLTTQTGDGHLRARPMAIADVQADGTIWLITQRHSPKVDEIQREHQVCVTMQSSTQYVSVSGTGTFVEDCNKIVELWSEYWRIWFPEGKDDPTLLLICVRGDVGEYWDNSGSSGLKYLIQAGKAYLSGTRPDVDTDPQIHGKVQMS